MSSTNVIGQSLLVVGLLVVGIYAFQRMISKQDSESYTYPLQQENPVDLSGYDPSSLNTNLANNIVPRFNISSNPNVDKPSLTSLDVIKAFQLNDKFKRLRQPLTSNYRESLDVVRKPVRNMVLSSLDPNHTAQAEVHVVLRHAETQSVLVDVIPAGVYTFPLKLPFSQENPLYIHDGSAPVVMDFYVQGLADLILYYEGLDDMNTPLNTKIDPYTIQVSQNMYLLVRNGAIDTVVNGVII